MSDAPIDARNARALLIEYLNLKVRQQDWHGVADAAGDLRELEARHPALRGPSP